MSYLVETYFDLATDDAVRRLWWRLHEEGISDSNLRNDSRPHLTMVTSPTLDAERFREALGRLAQRPQVSLLLSSLGCFPDGRPTVFLAPTVTTELLSLHQDLCEAVADCGGGIVPMQAPGRWIPHVSLARRLKPEDLPRALEVLRDEPLRLDGAVVRIGLLRDHPIVDLAFEDLEV